MHDPLPPEPAAPLEAITARPSEPGREHTLTQHTLSGLFWMFSGTSVLAVLRTGVMMILARLLTPEDYGLVSAAMIVVTFAQLFSQLGIGPALIQRPQLEERHLRTGFTIFTLSGVLVGAGIAAAAPLIAAFFERQDLIPILLVASLAFPLQGLAAVPSSLLTREMQFRRLAGIGVITYFGGYGIVGIGGALLGLGAWALVGANLAQFLLNVTILFFVRPFPKRPLLERRAFRELMYFGGGFTAGRILGYIAEEGDYAVVGRWLGTSALGIYNRAYNLLVLPATYFSNVLDQVLFPVLSRVQDDAERLRLGYRYGMAVVALVILPVSAAAILLAPELITVMLGPTWSGVIVPFQILAVGMLFRTAARINSSVARATGAIYRRAWREGVYALCVVVGALLGQRWGVPGVAWAVLLALTIHYLLMTQFSLVLVAMPVRTLLSAQLPGLITASLVAALIAPLAIYLRGRASPALLTLFLATAVAGPALLILARLLPRVLLGPDGVQIVEMLALFARRKVRRLRTGVRPAKEGIRPAGGNS